MDLAYLGIKVNYQDVDKAVKALDKLERKADSVVSSLNRLRTFQNLIESQKKLETQVKRLNREYSRASSAISRVDSDLLRFGQTTEKVSKSSKKFSNILVEWWKRFGEVALAFTIVYRAMNLVEAGLSKLISAYKEGIAQAGEFASLQYKLALYLSMNTDLGIEYADALKQVKGVVYELMGAARQSLSSVSELTAGLDELYQHGVRITPEMVKNFAAFNDFIIVIAQTTGDNVRQIRSELSGLLEGQLRATNVVVRALKQTGILTEEEIEKLRSLGDKTEIVNKLLSELGPRLRESISEIIRADPEKAFGYLWKSITFSITQSELLASKLEGVKDIFAGLFYRTGKKLTDFFKFDQTTIVALENIRDILETLLSFTPAVVELFNWITSLFKAGDYFIRGLKDTETELIGVKDVLYGISAGLQFIGSFAGRTIAFLVDSVAKGLQTIQNILVEWYRYIANTFIPNFGRVLTDSVLTFFEGFSKALWKVFTLHKDEADEIMEDTFSKIKDIVSKGLGKDFSDLTTKTDLQVKGFFDYLKKRFKEYGSGLGKDIDKIIQDYMIATGKWKVPALKSVKVKLTEKDLESLKIYNQFIKDYRNEIEELQSILGVHIKKLDEQKELEKIIKELNKKGVKITDERKKKLEELTKQYVSLISKLRDYAESVRKDLAPPIEKLYKEYKVLDLAVKRGFLTSDEARLYIAKLAKSLYDLNSPIEEIAKSLPKAKDKWDDFFDTLKKSEYIEKLERKADPVKRFIEDYRELGEAIKKVTISDHAYAVALAKLSSGLVDVKGHEEEWIQILEINSDKLKKLPAAEIALKLKELANVFQDNRTAWQKGIDDYIDSVKDMSKAVSNIVTDVFKNLENSLVDFITKGKASFADFVNSIMRDIARLFVRQYITLPLAMSLRGVTAPIGATSIASGTGSIGTGLGLPFGLSKLGGIFNYTLPGTAASMPAGVAHFVNRGINLPSSVMAQYRGITLGQALGVGALAGLGYSTIGNWIGLPQSQYSGLTASLGGALGYWGGSAAGVSLGASLGSVVPIIGTVAGAVAGGLLGSALARKADDADLHIYIGNPNNPNAAIVGGKWQKEFFEWDRAVGKFIAVNIRKGDVFSEEQARQMEQQIADYFTNLFNNIENIFGISLEEAIGNQALGYHENKYKGDIQTTIRKYTDVFFQYFTDELTGAILGYRIGYDTLKKFRQANESIADTFVRVVQTLKEIPNSIDLIKKYMNEASVDIVEAYNKLVNSWNYINDLVSNAFKNITLPTGIEDFRNQILGNIRNIIGQNLIAMTYGEFQKAISEYLLEKYGIRDYQALITQLHTGEVSIDSFNKMLEDLGRFIDQNKPKLDTLIQQLKELGFAASQLAEQVEELKKKQLEEAEKQLEEARRTYIGALKDKISELQEAQEALERRFNEAKQAYLKALSEEINKKQEAVREAENLVNTFDDLVNSIRSYRTELIGSAIFPQVSYAYSRVQFYSLINRLRTADVQVAQEILGQIPSTARAFLELSKEYATYEEYLRDYYTVIKALNEAEAKGLRVQKEQRDSIAQIQEEIKDLNERYKNVSGETILSLAEAEKQYYEAKMALDSSHYVEEIKYYQQILQSLQGVKISIEQARLSYEKALANYKQAQQEYARVSGGGAGGGSVSRPSAGGGYTPSSIRTVSEATLAGMLLERKVTPEEYVANLYEKYLGRQPDPEGYKYWVNRTKEVLQSVRGFSDISKIYDINKGFKAGALAHGERLRMQYFASGGTVTEPTLAVLGEAGVEHVIPDNQLQTIREELSQMREILWMLLNTNGDSNKITKKLYNIFTQWDYEGLPETRS